MSNKDLDKRIIKFIKSVITPIITLVSIATPFVATTYFSFKNVREDIKTVREDIKTVREIVDRWTVFDANFAAIREDIKTVREKVEKLAEYGENFAADGFKDAKCGLNDQAGIGAHAYDNNSLGLKRGDIILIKNPDEPSRIFIELQIEIVPKPKGDNTIGDFFISTDNANKLGLFKNEKSKSIGIFHVKMFKKEK